MSSLVGQVLGQTYLVVEPIGAGAMGVVYVVEHLTLKKRFAAKLLTADLARFPEAVARFEVEAHAVSQLDHENIVSVIDFGKTDDGCVFIIMELLRGKTLQARVDQGPLSAEETVAIIMQVCHALAAAHAAGIVHRDMKPENIFLTQRPGGRPIVKVLDFGISKARETSMREQRITKQGQLLGSPHYMSPEASRGDEVDARADIYAVGVILYELVCGDVPFRHDNYLKVLQMHATQPARPPRELVPDMPEAMEALILRALEKDPRRRQATIEELEGELIAAVPDVVQRALLRSQTPLHGQWLASSTQPMPYMQGSSPDLGERSSSARIRPEPVQPTIDTSRRGKGGLLIAMWSATVVMAATAVILVVLVVLRPARSGRDAEVAPPPAPFSAGASAVRSSPATGAAAAPAHPAEAASAREVTQADLPGARPAGGASASSGNASSGNDREERAGTVRRSEGSAPSGATGGYPSATRTVPPVDRDGDIHLALQREPRRPSAGGASSSSSRRNGNGSGSKSSRAGDRSSGRSGDDDGRPSLAADLDIKEGR